MVLEDYVLKVESRKVVLQYGKLINHVFANKYTFQFFIEGICDFSVIIWHFFLLVVLNNC